LVQVLAEVDCAITWIDSREQQFPARVPEHTRIEFSESPEHEVRLGAPGAFYLVMTHSHALDLEIVDAILRRGDAGFVGLIGSKTKRYRFEHRLAARGHGDDAIGTMVSPIGVAGITGKAPGIVAVAVAAQLLQQAQTQSASDAEGRAISVRT
jgi:xanthine dehydrogenase accessory factor